MRRSSPSPDRSPSFTILQDSGVVIALLLAVTIVYAFDNSSVTPIADSAGLASPIAVQERDRRLSQNTPAEKTLRASRLNAVASGGAVGTDETKARTAVTKFFGISGHGQTFVYVVDCSGSMHVPGKFDRAQKELLRSIKQLTSEQRYFVIFYNNTMYPMDSGAAVQATQEQVAKTEHWINGMRASGGTNPLPALRLALTLRPDAIYFLSDGLFSSNTVTEMKVLNGAQNAKQIPIHTIAFVSRSAERLMRAIANDSGGEYRFVE